MALCVTEMFRPLRERRLTNDCSRIDEPTTQRPKNEDALSSVASGAQLAVFSQEADIDGDGCDGRLWSVAVMSVNTANGGFWSSLSDNQHSTFSAFAS